MHDRLQVHFVYPLPNSCFLLQLQWQAGMREEKRCMTKVASEKFVLKLRYKYSIRRVLLNSLLSNQTRAEGYIFSMYECTVTA